MPVKQGDKVKLHFRGRLKGGEMIATTEGKEPVEFKAGVGEILPGIDDELIGMNKNEEKEITLSPEKGFGQRKEELIVDVGKRVLQGKKVQVGQRINVQTQQGRVMPAQVVEIKEDRITLDLNHPLAGKELTFNIKVVDIG